MGLKHFPHVSHSIISWEWGGVWLRYKLYLKVASIQIWREEYMKLQVEYPRYIGAPTENGELPTSCELRRAKETK